jgi:predicted metal-dependent enzyme (double-stranded beta helix superfamily)
MIRADNIATADLQSLVEGLALHSGLWRDGLVHDADERQFALIARTERVEVWAVAWMPGQDTGFHDHDASAAAITVYEGAVVDERMAIGSPSISNIHDAGASFCVAAGEIHRVRHAGDVPSITLHAYSPPLDRMGSYEVRSDGRLLRTPLEGDEALSAG